MIQHYTGGDSDGNESTIVVVGDGKQSCKIKEVIEHDGSGDLQGMHLVGSVMSNNMMNKQRWVIDNANSGGNVKSNTSDVVGDVKKIEKTK